MPLLVSPIDGTTPMQQIVRNGIEIDRCPVSGGVWLDKGELEKLLGAMQEAIQEDRQEYAHYRQSFEKGAHKSPSAHPQSRSMYRDDEYDGYYRHKHGKPSKFRSLFDLFD
ncbi:MAG: zf-TFIIB domain-containing protein [Holosporales bacterium]|jgi:Zn-finger nucleic acid-binding protein